MSNIWFKLKSGSIVPTPTEGLVYGVKNGRTFVLITPVVSEPDFHTFQVPFKGGKRIRMGVPNDFYLGMVLRIEQVDPEIVTTELRQLGSER